MAKYIKSYSNYVLKSKHQNLANGTIFERDITTIGGRDQFAKNQVPIYRSGNFIITINGENNKYKKLSSKPWYENDSGKIWNSDILRNYEKDEKTSYDKKLVIKKDYFDLRDYAYYGSCSELIRASITDILKKYPGELFIPYRKEYVGTNLYSQTESDETEIQYDKDAADATFGENDYLLYLSGLYDTYKSFDEVRYSSDKIPESYKLTVEEKESLEKGIPFKRRYGLLTDASGTNGPKENCNDSSSGEIKTIDVVVVDNPFGINIHDRFVPKGENPLKYFAEGGIDNYVAYKYKEGECKGDYDTIADRFYDGSWNLDEEYKIEIISSVFDGLGECENTKSILSIGAGNCKDSDCKDNCGKETIVKLNLIASTEYETSGSTEDFCLTPGKYIGYVELGFKKIDYKFETKPTGAKDINDADCEDCTNGIQFNEYNLSGETVLVESYKIGDLAGRLKIYLFVGEDYTIKYFVENFSKQLSDTESGCTSNGDNRNNFIWRIRPKRNIINDFFENELDLFEQLLLNRDSDPVYTSSFEIVDENKFGYYTTTKSFTFPTTYGGYNLGSSGPLYSQFINELSKIADFYDDRFSDNLWRSMTHEAIKNFDWTCTRNYSKDEEEPFVEGGSRIQKIIRLFGREFDEIKNYASAIKDNNKVTYDNASNLPSYFFTDRLEDYGWDVNQVKPLVLSEYVNEMNNTTTELEKLFCQNGFYIKEDDGTIVSGKTIEDARKHNVFYLDAEGKRKFVIKRNFVEQYDDTYVVPYAKNNITGTRTTKYGGVTDATTTYSFDFPDADGDSCYLENFSVGVEHSTGEKVINGYHNDCGDIIRVYSNENRYTPSDVNTEFIRRLILNSKQLWAHKGTVDGMEMLLAMFGLKSKRSIFKNDTYFKCKKKSLFTIQNNPHEELGGLTTTMSRAISRPLPYDGGVVINQSFSGNGIASEFVAEPIDRFETTLVLTDTSGNTWSDGKRYYGSNDLDKLYDYDIKEYSMFTTYLEDELLPDKDMCRIDWLNSKKLITYNTDDFKNGIYVDYQGLPVSYENKYATNEDGEEVIVGRRLYPHFETSGIYDGNPYYQMNGGWLQKRPFAFDVNNNIVPEDSESNKRKSKGLFTETVKNIHCVNNLQSLLSDATVGGQAGDIIQVLDISGRYAIVDGIVYPLIQEYESEYGESYFYVTAGTNSVIIGKSFFSDYVIISNPYMDDNIQRIDLSSGAYNNRRIKVYVIESRDENDNKVYSMDAYSSDESISTFTVFEGGKYMDGDDYTNYFKLNNPDFRNELSLIGWQQLRSDEFEYYRLNVFENYNKGNNPHYGHMNYDNGHEYLTYFSQLFKHTIKNELLDYRQFGGEDYSLLDESIDENGNIIRDKFSNIGFKNLLNTDESCDIDYDKYLRLDDKCHFFGSFIERQESDKFKQKNSCTAFKKRSLTKPVSSATTSPYYITDIIRSNYIDVSTKKVTIDDLRYGKILKQPLGEDGLENTKWFKDRINGITDQIVNTKRMEIDFFIKDAAEYTKEWLEEVKYIDSIILPYLTQMMPSGVICRVNYKTVS